MPEISTENTPAAQSLDWVPIPAEIARLGGSALVAWARIASAGGCNPDDPSTITATIGLADLDLSDTTARNAVARLESTGLLVIDRAPGRASTYTLHRSTSWAQLPVAMAELDAGPIAAWSALYLSGTFEDRRRNTTVRRLASWLGVGLRTVRRWISELVQTSFLKRIGDYIYELRQPPPPDPPLAPPPNLAANRSKSRGIFTGACGKPGSASNVGGQRPDGHPDNRLRPTIAAYTPPEPLADEPTPERKRAHIAAMRDTLARRRG